MKKIYFLENKTLSVGDIKKMGEKLCNKLKE